MPFVDLGPRTPAPTHPDRWHGLPRRVGLTRRELEHLASLLSFPLPWPVRLQDPGAAADPADPVAGGLPHGRLEGRLDGRLGSRPRSATDEWLARALAHPDDPHATLVRRGLVLEDDDESDGKTDGKADSGHDGHDRGTTAATTVESGVRGALGLLAAPRLALDLDVRVEGTRVRAWHRQADGAVATLATADGVVFELAWFGLEHWGAELGRLGRLPEDVELRRSDLPPVLDLPYELLDAAGEAGRTHRPDLLPVLARRYAGTVLAEDGTPLDAVQVQGLLAAIAVESRGRLRALSVAVEDEQPTPAAGIVSWLLLADGWHAVRAHGPGEALRIELALVEPGDLAACLAPVLAEVAR